MEVTKVLYIVVVNDNDVNNTDDNDNNEITGKTESFRYTRPVLQTTLQLMGCKARHAFKVLLYFI